MNTYIFIQAWKEQEVINKSKAHTVVEVGTAQLVLMFYCHGIETGRIRLGLLVCSTVKNRKKRNKMNEFIFFSTVATIGHFK